MGGSIEVKQQQLSDWGFSAAVFLDPQTHLLQPGYQDTLAEAALLHPERMPTPIHNQIVKTVGGVMTANGLGHLRVWRAFDRMFQLAGYQTVPLNVSDPTGLAKDTILGRLFSVIQPRYEKESVKVGIELGLAPQTALDHFPIPTTFAHALLNLFERQSPESYHQVMMGKLDRRLTHQGIETQMFWYRFLCKANFQKLLDKLEVTDVFLPYPGFNLLLNQGISIGTDSVLEPRGWSPVLPIFVQTETAKQILVAYWGQEYADNIMVTDGFPTPLGALLHRETHARIRSEQAAAGQDICLIMPASGSAWAQASLFGEGTQTIAPYLETLGLKVILHSGTGVVGEQVGHYVDTHLKDLPSKVKNRILRFNSPTGFGSVDFFEALVDSQVPIVVISKASEQACIALQLGIPMIIPGAIGDHEIWNAAMAVAKGLPVFLLPPAYTAVKTLIDSSEFPAHLKSAAEKYLAESQADNFLTAVKRCRHLFEPRPLPSVNLGMMAEVVNFMFKHAAPAKAPTTLPELSPAP